MSGDFDHILLTRFNLPTPGVERVARAREGWLKNRVALFERYCIPSVQAQTNQAFRWIIYFDSERPEWLKERIQEHVEKEIYVPIFRSSVDNDELIADISKVTGTHSRRLLTTNLDNDDALAVDFVDRLQAAAPQHDRSAIYLARGLIKSEPHVYLRIDKRNAFASVAADWKSPFTCWSDWHNLLGRHMPTCELYEEPGWLQVVHGGNVSNRIRGQLVAPATYTHLFPGLIDDVQAPGRTELMIDKFVAQPRRFVRDSGRTVGKTILMRLLGKEFLNEVKALFASRSRGKKSQQESTASSKNSEDQCSK